MINMYKLNLEKHPLKRYTLPESKVSQETKFKQNDEPIYASTYLSGLPENLHSNTENSFTKSEDKSSGRPSSSNKPKNSSNKSKNLPDESNSNSHPRQSLNDFKEMKKHDIQMTFIKKYFRMQNNKFDLLLMSYWTSVRKLFSTCSISLHKKKILLGMTPPVTSDVITKCSIKSVFLALFTYVII
jgi:hypothetical protein